MYAGTLGSREISQLPFGSVRVVRAARTTLALSDRASTETDFSSSAQDLTAGAAAGSDPHLQTMDGDSIDRISRVGSCCVISAAARSYRQLSAATVRGRPGADMGSSWKCIGRS